MPSMNSWYTTPRSVLESGMSFSEMIINSYRNWYGQGAVSDGTGQTESGYQLSGMERYSSVLLRALQKMEEEPLPNLYFLCEDAAELPEMFAKEELNRIYLNFSDPWPKARHAKRRLTSTEFLARYNQVLAADGHIEFKTDNMDLFDFSLESVEEAGWKLVAAPGICITTRP